MKCSCPKCSALLPEDLPNIPEKGKNGKCSKCNSTYWIQRESFMLRCYAVTGERYCSHCGEGLGPSTFCPGCGTLYPDYCIVHSKKPAQRLFEKKQITLNFSFPKFAGKSATSGRKQGLIIPEGRTRPSDLRHQLLMVGAGITFLAVVIAVSLFYMQARAESNFIRRFVVVLYGIQSGTDYCMKMSELLASGSRLTDKDLALLRSAKAENTTALGVLSPPPKKFTDIHNQLLKLSGTYEKLNDLCITAGPSAEIASSAGALESRFHAQARELKGALPPEMIAEITAKASRFNNLQYLLN